jgi:hypothetical protein
VALAPVSVARIVAHRWFVPIAMTWAMSAVIAIHFLGRWLTGLGPECDRVLWVATTSGFCVVNGWWLGHRLWRSRLTVERNRRAQQNAVVVSTAI